MEDKDAMAAVDTDCLSSFIAEQEIEIRRLSRKAEEKLAKQKEEARAKRDAVSDFIRERYDRDEVVIRHDPNNQRTQVTINGKSAFICDREWEANHSLQITLDELTKSNTG